MRVILRLLAVMLLLVISLFGAGATMAQTDDDDDEVNGEQAEADAGLSFQTRFVIPAEVDDPEAESGEDSPPPLVVVEGSSCAPTDSPTMGFVRRGQTSTVRMDLVSRIGFWAITPNGLGNINLNDDEKTNLRAFTHEVHRYGAQADLVVARSAFSKDLDQGSEVSGAMDGPLALGKSFVLLNLVDEIADLVREYEFDGVTIDFTDVLHLTTEDIKSDITTSFEFFLRRMKLALAGLPGDQKLNLVLPFDQVDGLEKEKLVVEELRETVDTFLTDGDTATALSSTVAEEKLMRIVLPDQELNPALDIKAGGAAVWAFDGLFDDKGQVRADSPVGQYLVEQGDKNVMEDLLEPYVCPNRSIIRKVAAGLGLVGLIGLSVWFLFYDLRRGRLLYPALVSVGVALALFAALVIADPFFEGLELEILLAGLLLVVLAGAFRFWMKRNESSYP